MRAAPGPLTCKWVGGGGRSLGEPCASETPAQLALLGTSDPGELRLVAGRFPLASAALRRNAGRQLAVS